MLTRNLICETIYKTHSGDFLDGSIYRERTITRARCVKHRVSSEAQQRLNEDNARRHAVRLVQNNFRSGVDFCVDLTYRAEKLPQDDERQRKDMRNFLNRVKRLYKRLGIDEELKYFGTALGGVGSRKHAHFIISGSKHPNLADEIANLWSFGYSNVRRLQADPDNGFADIVNYICNNSLDSREEGEKIYSKRWCASRNLQQPEAQQRRGKISRAFIAKVVRASFAERKELIESKFPGYKAVEIDVSEIKDAPEDRKHRIFGDYYIYLRMRKYTAAELKERRQTQNPRKK